MDVANNEEELDIEVSGPPSIITTEAEDEDRPCTPPMSDYRLNKSLGLMLSPQSPPYRRIRSMKLVDSPRSFIKSRFDHPCTSTPAASPGLRALHANSPRCRTDPTRKSSRLGVPANSSYFFNNRSFNTTFNVINPFSAINRSADDLKTVKRPKRSPKKSLDWESSDSSDNLELCLDNGTRNRPRLSDFHCERYRQEFLEMEVLGVGVHGCVYKCLNIINGIDYAVKRSLKPVINEKIAHNEIYAHGVLEHPNIVRNYSNWTENDYVYMQNEYCNGGSLEETIARDSPLDERQLTQIMEHVAQGLRFIHSKQLVHMDIKPANILIRKGPKLLHHSNCDEFDEDEPTEEVTYKIADLGHVTRVDENVDVEEGDCRYLPREILNDDFSNLTKVDIFALGLTLYEAAGGGPLPKNGNEWHKLREGEVVDFPQICPEFNRLISRMIHPDPTARPSAVEILSAIKSPPFYKVVKDEHMFKNHRQKVQLLERKLEDVMKYVQVVTSKSQSDGRRIIRHSDRLVAKLKNASRSVNQGEKK